jgi:8-oxo-dGTP pyrophosphatase MutT (NUDIX family)
MKFKIVNSKVVLSHPRMTLLEDTIKLPDSSTTTYLYTKYNGNTVTIICRDKENKILVQKEFNYPSRKYLIQFPGGSVPLKEKIEVGANRELMEEAGLAASDLKLIGKYYLDNRRSKAMMYVFLATIFKYKKEEGDELEELETTWLRESEINQMIREGKIQNPHFLAAWSLYNLMS